MHTEGQIFERQGLLRKMNQTGGPAEFHEPSYSDIYDLLSAQAQENHAAGGGRKPLTKTEVATLISSSQAAKNVIEAEDSHRVKHRDSSHLEGRLANIYKLLKVKKGLPDNIFSAEDVIRLEEKVLKLIAERNTAWNEVQQTNEELPDGLRENHERPGLPVEGEC